MELDEGQRAAQAQFGRQSERYGGGHILADVSDVAAAAERMGLTPGSTILDVACGAGHTGLYFAELGCRVTLTDLAEPMLERVKEAAAERELEVETRQHSAEVLPYETGSMDAVTCRVAAHHFSDPGAFVAGSARVLREAGWFLLIDGSVPDDEQVAKEWTHKVEKLRDPSHGRFLTPEEWRGLCAESHLAVTWWVMEPFKMPDLEWYFETAATPVKNRAKVRELLDAAPAAARRVFRVGEEDGKTVWWWQRLSLLARKGGAGDG